MSAMALRLLFPRFAARWTALDGAGRAGGLDLSVVGAGGGGSGGGTGGGGGRALLYCGMGGGNYKGNEEKGERQYTIDIQLTVACCKKIYSMNSKLHSQEAA